MFSLQYWRFRAAQKRTLRERLADQTKYRTFKCFRAILDYVQMRRDKKAREHAVRLVMLEGAKRRALEAFITATQSSKLNRRMNEVAMQFHGQQTVRKVWLAWNQRVVQVKML